MCHIAVIPSVQETSADDLVGKTAVVIDVLRATSTMIIALANGCAGIIPVETVCHAKELQSDGIYIGGERGGRKIPGFDYGNSPFEYMSPELKGKVVVMTTTNGTRAIQKAARASHVIAAALLNGRAAAARSLAFRRDIVIVCAGTKDRFSLEDGLCAGFLIHEIERLTGDMPELDDMGKALRCAYLQVQHRLAEEILASRNGKRLVKVGLKEEVAYCAQTNVVDVVPVLEGDMLIADVLKPELLPYDELN